MSTFTPQMYIFYLILKIDIKYSLEGYQLIQIKVINNNTQIVKI